MGGSTLVDVTVQLMASVMEYAVPVAVVVELSNIIVCTFLRAAFGGRLWFGH